MQKLFSTLVLAACVVTAYLAWETASESPYVENLSRQVACGEFSGCSVEAAPPHRIERNVFRHRYDWATSLGPAMVECRKDRVWIGGWKCVVDRKAVGMAGQEVGAYPDAVPRGRPK